MNQALNTELLKYLESQGHLETQAISRLKPAEQINAEGQIRQLFDHGLVDERFLADSIGKVFNLERIDTTDFPQYPVGSTSKLSSFLIEHEALPLREDDTNLYLAMCDPTDQLVRNVLESKVGKKIVPQIAVRSELNAQLRALYLGQDKSPSFSSRHDTPNDLTNEDPGVRSLHQVIQAAIATQASDIHFEPAGSDLRVRFRVNGILHNHRSYTDSVATRIQARLKLISGMDVSQKRLPQSGRFQFPHDGRVFDFRSSTLPLYDGESIVLRILESKLGTDSLENLGFRASLAAELKKVITSRHGLFLVTGPTGSGKSTTLYSLLNMLDGDQLKIVSIEDPVELAMPKVNQIQVDRDHGVDFASALRAVMRQDPDVVMVGEIRDEETALLAAQAALTGHLVLSTLHTNSAVSTINRLRNLGLKDYLIDGSLKGILAQRLIRTTGKPTSVLEDIENTSGKLALASRTVIAEYLPFRELHTLKTDPLELSNELFEKINLRSDAQRVLDSGETLQEEIHRVLGEFDSIVG